MSGKIERIEEMKVRTKKLTVRVIHLFQALPKREEARILGKQLLRSASSVGANYRAVARNKSEADKLNKLKIVLEEADESVFWLEVLGESGIMEVNLLEPLIDEYSEIVKMMSTAIQNLKNRPK